MTPSCRRPSKSTWTGVPSLRISDRWSTCTKSNGVGVGVGGVVGVGGGVAPKVCSGFSFAKGFLGYPRLDRATTARCLPLCRYGVRAGINDIRVVVVTIAVGTREKAHSRRKKRNVRGGLDSLAWQYSIATGGTKP